MDINDDDFIASNVPISPRQGMICGLPNQAVQVVHKPTGTSFTCSEFKSAHANRVVAIERCREKVINLFGASK